MTDPQAPVGKTVGRYRILSEIGSGGMGMVYRAEDPTLQRTVALKILTDPDPKMRRRFVREAIAASKLSHPNVAVVYEAGESDDGTAFIAMQLVDGETLRDREGRSAIRPDEAVRIAAEVADALDDAHGHGLVHRDIKPGNIMIDSRGHAKVLDFGIAKMIDEAATPDEATAVADTTAGMFVGTLQYVSPEQAGLGPVDRRSDIFSLGIVMYEMLSGANPFAAPTVFETMRRIREMPIEPIRGASPDLNRIVLRCLEKNPERRYQTARDLVLDLEAIESAPGVAVSRRAWVAPATLVAAVGVVLLGLVAMAWFIARRPQTAVAPEEPKIRSIAVLPFENFSADRQNEYIGDGITEEVINGLAQLRDLNVVSRTSAFAFKGKDADVRGLGKLLGADAVVEGSVQREGNRLRVTAQLINTHTGYHLWSETYNGAVDDVFSVEDRIARAVAAALQQTGGHGAGPRTRDIVAYDFYLKARHEETFYTRKNFDDAVANYQLAIERDPSFAEAFAGLAETYSLMDHRPGLTSLPPATTEQLALDWANKALILDPGSAEAHTALGHIFMHLGRFGEAGVHLERALHLNPNYVNAYVWRGTLLRSLGRYSDSLADWQRAKQLDPLSSFVATFWAKNAWMAGDFQGSIRETLRGIELEPDYAELPLLLAQAYAALDRPSEAEEALRRAEQAGPPPTFQEDSALVRALLGRKSEAAQRLRSLANRNPSPQPTAMMRAWAAVGDLDQAGRWLDRTVKETPDFGRIGMDLPRLPAFAKFRSDPRYVQARLKLGLPPPTDTAGTSPAAP